LSGDLMEISFRCKFQYRLPDEPWTFCGLYKDKVICGCFGYEVLCSEAVRADDVKGDLHE